MNKKRVALALAAALGVNTLMVTVGQVGEQITIAHAQNARLSTEDAKKLQGVTLKQLNTTVTTSNLEDGTAEIVFDDIKAEDIEKVSNVSFAHELFNERKDNSGKALYGDTKLSDGTAKAEWKNGKLVVTGAKERGIYTGEVTITYKDKTEETYALTLVNKKEDTFTTTAEVTPGVIQVTDAKLNGVSLVTGDELSIRSSKSSNVIQTVKKDAANGWIFGNKNLNLKEGEVYELVYNYGTGKEYTVASQIMLTKEDKVSVEAFATNEAGFDAKLKAQIVSDYKVADADVVVNTVVAGDINTIANKDITVSGTPILDYEQTVGGALANLGGAKLDVKFTTDGNLNVSVSTKPGSANNTPNFVNNQTVSYGFTGGNAAPVASTAGVIGDYYFQIDGKSNVYFSDKSADLKLAEDTASTVVYAGATVDLPTDVGINLVVPSALVTLEHGYSSIPVIFDAKLDSALANVDTVSAAVKVELDLKKQVNPAYKMVQPEKKGNYAGEVKTSIIVSADKLDATSVQGVFNKTGEKTGTFTLVGGAKLVKDVTVSSNVLSSLSFLDSNVRAEYRPNSGSNDLVFNITFTGTTVPTDLTWNFKVTNTDLVSGNPTLTGTIRSIQQNLETVEFNNTVGVRDVANTDVFEFTTYTMKNIGSGTADYTLNATNTTNGTIITNVRFSDITNKQNNIQARTTTGKYQGNYRAGLWITQQPFTAVAKDAKSVSNTSASLVVDANFFNTTDIAKVPGGVIQYSEKTVNGNTTTWSEWKDSPTKVEKSEVKEDAITKTVTGLTGGKTYKFRVVYDYNNGTKTEKVYSNETTEVTLPTSSSSSTITGSGGTTTGTSTGSTTITVTTSNSTLTGTSASVTLPSGFRYDSGKNPVAVTFKYKDKDGKIVTETKEQYSNVTVKFNGNNVELNGLVPGKDYNEITVDYTDNNGKTRSIILKNVKTTSQTQVETYLANVYEVVFGRPADEAGYHFHLDNLKNKKVSLRDFLLNMLNEKEFVEKYKSTEEKIEALYNAIVNRTSDEAGKKFWVDEYKKVLAVYGSESTALRAIADRMVNENELKELADKMGVQW